MSKFICAATPILNEAYCLNDYLDSIIALVDGVVVVIDDRTNDGSDGILITYGVDLDWVGFENFGQIGNKTLDFARELGYEYALILNPDERIQEDIFYKMLGFIKDNPDVEVFHVARKNWYDLERTEERTDVFPDLQGKVVKLNSGVKYRGAVHETLTGYSRTAVMPLDIYTDHFNLHYYKTGEQDYEKKIAQYNKLAGKS